MSDEDGIRPDMLGMCTDPHLPNCSHLLSVFINGAKPIKSSFEISNFLIINSERVLERNLKSANNHTFADTLLATHYRAVQTKMHRTCLLMSERTR